jgi:hypothetical protein
MLVLREVEVCMSGSRSLKVAGQAWRTKREQGARQPPPLTRRFSKLERWYWHFYVVEHCPRIVLKASDEFQPLTHLPTREIGSLLFVPPWCTLLAERPYLHCHSIKENDAIKVKVRSRDHSSTNSKHACAESSVTNLKVCYGKSADNFELPTHMRRASL